MKEEQVTITKDMRDSLSDRIAADDYAAVSRQTGVSRHTIRRIIEGKQKTTSKTIFMKLWSDCEQIRKLLDRMNSNDKKFSFMILQLVGTTVERILAERELAERKRFFNENPESWFRIGIEVQGKNVSAITDALTDLKIKIPFRTFRLKK